jgi:hypothetical protein
MDGTWTYVYLRFYLFLRQNLISFYYIFYAFVVRIYAFA